MSDYQQHGHTTGQGADAPLPYFDEYLNAVLRPRVERILAREQDEWNALVWKALVKTILSEQRPGSPITPDNLERMLRETLGLRIEARVETTFHGEPATLNGSEHAAESQSGQTGAPPTSHAVSGRVDNDDVITSRRPMSPLVRAVAGPRRG